MASRAASSASAGARSIEHVDVAPDEPSGRDEDEHRDEERRGRVGALIAGPDEQEPEQDRARPGQVAAEVERAGRECRAREPSGARRETMVRLASIAITRPMTANVYQAAFTSVRVADEMGTCLPGDEEARHDEDRGLGERREVLCLAVPVLVSRVGRPGRDADGEERQQRRDEVGAGVQRLRDEPEAAAGEAGSRASARSGPPRRRRTRAQYGAAGPHAKASSGRSSRPHRGEPDGLEVAAEGLLALDRLEQRFEVALAEAARPVPLDHLEEERRPILTGFVKICSR